MKSFRQASRFAHLFNHDGGLRILRSYLTSSLVFGGGFLVRVQISHRKLANLLHLENFRPGTKFSLEELQIFSLDRLKYADNS